MVAEADFLLSVLTFKELTMAQHKPNGLFSVKMRLGYNIITYYPNKTDYWQYYYIYIKSDEHYFHGTSEGQLSH